MNLTQVFQDFRLTCYTNIGTYLEAPVTKSDNNRKMCTTSTISACPFLSTAQLDRKFFKPNTKATAKILDQVNQTTEGLRLLFRILREWRVNGWHFMHAGVYSYGGSNVLRTLRRHEACCNPNKNGAKWVEEPTELPETKKHYIQRQKTVCYLLCIDGGQMALIQIHRFSARAFLELHHSFYYEHEHGKNQANEFV